MLSIVDTHAVKILTIISHNFHYVQGIILSKLGISMRGLMVVSVPLSDHGIAVDVALRVQSL